MSDILAVLDKQAAQTQDVILRLSERLNQTQQLQQLEIERRKTEARVTGLEARLRDIETEMGGLRQQAAHFDPARLKTAAIHLDQVWQSAFGGETAFSATTGAFAPVISPVEPPPTSLVEPEPVAADPLPPPRAEITEEPAAPAPASAVVAPLDADTVLGSFLGGNDWTGGSGSFFSAAQELGSDTDLDDWWQEDQPEPATPDYLADMSDFGFGLPLSQPVPELAGAMMEPATGGQNGRKKGILGRFF